VLDRFRRFVFLVTIGSHPSIDIEGKTVYETEPQKNRRQPCRL
jgi:hypothetical protein